MLRWVARAWTGGAAGRSAVAQGLVAGGAGTTGVGQWVRRKGTAAEVKAEANEVARLQAELEAEEVEHQRLTVELQKSMSSGRKSICVFGAGLSAKAAIRYLVDHAEECGWHIHVGDQNVDTVHKLLEGRPNTSAFAFDVADAETIETEVAAADLVISMVPAHLHGRIVRPAVENGVDVVTASYVSDEIRELDALARKRGSLVMMECGVDPGIDHMSAMHVLQNIRAEGGTVTSFESFTGGLVADDSDDNPWKYKFTWNPRNVVLAGQGVSKFVYNGTLKYMPYWQLFQRIEHVEIPENPLAGASVFEGYANRDSLSYRQAYGLEHCPTVFRGTLRKPGFCAAWDVFVQLGLTDDSYVIPDSENMTYRQFINSFLMWRPEDTVELKLAYHLGISFESAVFEQLRWLGIFEHKKIGLPNATPAKVLEKLLTSKLVFTEKDRDMLVMFHRIQYETLSGQNRQVSASLVSIGEGESDPSMTAMAKTVGLPVGIVTKLILQGKVTARGVQIPTFDEVTTPVLDELATLGIALKEIDEPLHLAPQS
ncbi:saccharopine dehydrogenase [Thecamonas trahens ATCC 50062]|uniref:Saccharopine dehydrogenase n=1 Tax=Thecamonas trahens ATCC 50062 TaxID=461836 RepID=A0A0L0D5T9_THETB|nr:saccharopine dehydrogenase [Thecamonas trahens ATCC 50062]KNC47742.1 saccharopine dehydrogenase [Thecamonas trahens ATCC 50062]|eukprot:XP_013759220.1 saccharopine dehydrogenase [Thecamonas trahens ATCC 50062]